MELIKTKFRDRNEEAIYVGDIIAFEQRGTGALIISKVINAETARRLRPIAGISFTDELDHIDNRSKILKRFGGEARHSIQ